MHDAFELCELISADVLGEEPVTALLLHAGRIYAGTEQGSLLVFDLDYAPSTTKPAQPKATFVSRHAGFVKKSIDQLAVLKELNGLLCLSAGDVTLHELPSFALIASFSPHTKGAASHFSISSNVSKVDGRAPEIHSTLAAACRRRLVLLRWLDGEWRTPHEVALPHQIRSMSFASSERTRQINLVAGFSTGEYGIVYMPSTSSSGSAASQPTLSELFVPRIPQSSAPAQSSTQDSPTATSAPSTSFGLGSFGKSANIFSGALALGGRKLAENRVALVPRWKGKRPARENERAGAVAWLYDDHLWVNGEDDLEDQVLVVRNESAWPLSPAGHLTRRQGGAQSLRCPSGTISDIAALQPYVVSLATKDDERRPSIVVHASDTLEMVQELPIENSDEDEEGTPQTSTSTARLLTTSAAASADTPFVAVVTSRNGEGSQISQSIHAGYSVSWQRQVEQLGERGQWEAAARFLRRAGAVGNELSSGLFVKLAKLHGLHLFNTGRYDAAIDLFIRLDVTPAKVAALYPRNIAGKLFVDPWRRESLFGGRAEVKLRATQTEEDVFTQGASSSPPTSPTKRALGRTAQDSEAVSLRSEMSDSRRRGQGGDSEPPVSPTKRTRTAAERANKDADRTFATSADALIRFLTDRRQQYSKALASMMPSRRPTPTNPTREPASPSELFALPDSALSSLRPEELARAAEVVDTVLFRAYLATKPVMVGPLCRIENWCEVSEVEELLLEANKHQDLIDLYHGKGLHARALQLLKRVADQEEDLELKLDPTVRYLQKLGAAHVDVIFASSRWVFDLDRAAGMQIFLADVEEVESLPRHRTMDFLLEIGTDCGIQYLEHIIHGLDESASEFHEKLIDLYLAKAAKDQADAEEWQSKLTSFLQYSTSYHADRVLARLPPAGLNPVRALLLGRLGRHEGALQIYVYQLKDHTAAAHYCKRVYSAPSTSAEVKRTIFLTLLRLYLRPQHPHPTQFEPAGHILAQYAHAIDANEVFELLPALTTLASVRTFLAKTLRDSKSAARESRMVRQVAQSYSEKLDGEIVDLEERRVQITESRVCPQCQKRLGNSVIAVHSPRGEVTHVACSREWLERNRRAAGT